MLKSFKVWKNVVFFLHVRLMQTLGIPQPHIHFSLSICALFA